MHDVDSLTDESYCNVMTPQSSPLDPENLAACLPSTDEHKELNEEIFDEGKKAKGKKDESRKDKGKKNKRCHKLNEGKKDKEVRKAKKAMEAMEAQDREDYTTGNEAASS